MSAVQRIAETRARLAEIDALRADAEREDAAAYAAAIRANWTEGELRQVGITAPARQAPGRPRKAKPVRQAVADGELGVGALLSTQARREETPSWDEQTGVDHAAKEPVGASA